MNSTIVKKKKICVSCGKQDYIFSKGRCKQCAVIESSLARINKAEEDETLPVLIDEVDELFSKYIRLKYADKKGIAECYTCGDKKRWQEQQCGHFKTRAIMYLRFDERNVRVQCKSCNEFKRGNITVFRNRLESEYPGITEILDEEMRTIYKYTRHELKQLKNGLMLKIHALKNRR